MGVFSAVAGVIGASSVSKYQKRATKANQMIGLIQSVRNYRGMIASARTATADVMSAGVAQGLDSSASQGNRASVNTQANTNDLDFRNTAFLNRRIEKWNARALEAQEDAQRMGAFAGVADMILSQGIDSGLGTPGQTNNPMSHVSNPKAKGP